ncbi:MAG: NTP transferase domain-containing protein, partial [Flavobacteriaceae bacterium]|nr:NTP transferase domain-containing protein [Flavobacteriaceae bacterium]
MGMGRSISEGVTYVQSNWPQASGILIMLSDQPLIDFEHLRSLMMALKRSNCGIIATSYDDENFGVPAIFSNQYFDQLRELNSDYGARELIRQHGNPACLVSGYNKAVDLDTTSDYEEFLKSNPQS